MQFRYFTILGERMLYASASFDFQDHFVFAIPYNTSTGINNLLFINCCIIKMIVLLK